MRVALRRGTACPSAYLGSFRSTFYIKVSVLDPIFRFTPANAFQVLYFLSILFIGAKAVDSALLEMFIGVNGAQVRF